MFKLDGDKDYYEALKVFTLARADLIKAGVKSEAIDAAMRDCAFFVAAHGNRNEWIQEFQRMAAALGLREVT
ncbi:hypothetical protein LB543_27680 [Mesorhizobium sp. ESP7-2]|nr:hypothetical protein [Mesorhizobium sp. ESP7-2]